MFSVSVYTLLLALWIGSHQVQGFIVKDGNCSVLSTNLPFVKNLDVEKYLGVWYERERYEQDFERNLECVTILYRSSRPIGMLEVKTRGYLPKDEKFQMFSGIGLFIEEPSANGTVAKLNISLSPGLNATNYWIVDTDYVNYSIVYSCTTYLESDQSVEGYWLLTRSQKRITDTGVLDRINYLRTTYFEEAHMRRTNQTEELCPSEPSLPPAPSSVVLPPL